MIRNLYYFEIHLISSKGDTGSDRACESEPIPETDSNSKLLYQSLDADLKNFKSKKLARCYLRNNNVA